MGSALMLRTLLAALATMALGAATLEAAGPTPGSGPDLRSPTGCVGIPAPHSATELGSLAASSSPSTPPRDALAPGKFLIATRRVTAPFFAETVILLIQYGPGGALGLVVNRPTPLALSQVLPQLEGLEDRADRVYVGGPVSPRTIMLLTRSHEKPPASIPVVGDVFVSGSLETLRYVLQEARPPSHLHVYVGYSGWAPGQLDAEVARGDWLVIPAQPDLVFHQTPSEVWPALMRENEGLRVRAGPGPRG